MSDKKDSQNKATKATKQYFEWGDIKWIQNSEDVNKSKYLVAHTTILPNQTQEEHFHTGDDQTLYIISGEGEQWVNDRYYSLVAGNVYYIKPFAKHQIQNTSNKPLEVINIYSVDNFDVSQLIPVENIIDNFYLEDPVKMIDLKRLQKIQDKFSEASYLGIVIKDISGNLLTTPSNIPKFCKIKSEHSNKCFLEDNYDLNNLKETKVFPCCSNTVRIAAPIFLGDKLVGTILCGPVIISEGKKNSEDDIKKIINEDKLEGVIEAYSNLRVVSKAQLYAIMETLRTISNSIVETSVINFINKERQEKTVQILKESETRRELEKVLLETKMKVIQSQMSPHFLFNTLSVIGQLAYMNGAKEAADTTFALSNLLRTTLTKSLEFVKIDEELKYINDYLFIQNKRFKDYIITKIQIDDDTKEIAIPFLTLQILIENAIVHGFKSMDRKWKLTIDGKLIGDRVELSVVDNGIGISKDKLNSIYDHFVNSSGEGIGIGLSSLKNRLEYYYGDDYIFEIDSNYGKGTKVRLVLPTQKKRGVGNEETSNSR
ncbi:PocR ligand-binding domain-containing protein [Clostridium sp. DL1XJH146]